METTSYYTRELVFENIVKTVPRVFDTLSFFKRVGTSHLLTKFTNFEPLRISFQHDIADTKTSTSSLCKSPALAAVKKLKRNSMGQIQVMITWQQQQQRHSN